MVRRPTWAWIALTHGILGIFGISVPGAAGLDHASYYELDDAPHSETDGSCCESDCCCCVSDCCCCPLWTVTADALILDRSRAAPRVLYLDQFAQDAPAINVDNLDPSTAAGPRISVIRHRPDRSDLEFTYFGIDGWNSQAGLSGASFQYAMNNLYGVSYDDIREIRLGYGSELSSFELNLRRQRNGWLTLLAGFRYLQLNETFQITDWYNGPASRETFLTDTQNRLCGVQIGADALLLQRGRLGVNALGKAGIYDNRSREASSYTYDRTAVTAKNNHAAFVGELAFTADYQLTPSLALRGGYQMMWIAGVALAAEQIDSTYLGVPPGALVNSSSDAFYHGAIVGLEYVR